MNDLYLKQECEQMSQINRESLGTGLYMLDISKKMNSVAYPWAPTVRLQKMGVSINKNMSLVDTESDLKNIVNVNSNDPTKKYMPDPDKKVEYQDLPDGFFHEESTLLTNPPSELRGLTKNRFYQLHKDPQKYAVEPFDRIGSDTYQDIMNNEQDC
tara:strand:- start:1979 stop:2446 length:468 start_codon:yes stop_codon:yes gene_type:complete